MRCPCMYRLFLTNRESCSTRVPAQSLTTANQRRTLAIILSHTRRGGPKPKPELISVGVRKPREQAHATEIHCSGHDLNPGSHGWLSSILSSVIIGSDFHQLIFILKNVVCLPLAMLSIARSCPGSFR